jgi:flagellar hook protein FlgE
MMRAMFSGVTGLNAHQTKMDVVGNNIANINTVGFKAGRVMFQEVFSQTLRAAGAPDQVTGYGGINPMQVGLGLGISAVDTITTRGSLQRTDSPTDVSIEGEGFFVVGGTNGGAKNFTRAGNFSLDRDGNLVSGNGLTVYGWSKYDEDPELGPIFDTNKEMKPLNIFYDQELDKDKRVVAAKETSRVQLVGNLNAGQRIFDGTIEDSSEPQFVNPIMVYDSLGFEHRLNLEYFKTQVAGGSNQWSVRIRTIDSYEEGLEPTISPTLLENIAFNSTGGLHENSVAIQSVTLTPGEKSGAKAMDIELNFSSLTMYDGDFTVRSNFVDGYKTGSLVSFSIGADGLITGVYDNGRQNPLGQLAVATFQNPAGLIKMGDNMYMESRNSGRFDAYKPGIGGAGTLNPGTLEMSNVDLSKEFAEMIMTQRGFQASSRIITSTDEMMQELINLKR